LNQMLLRQVQDLHILHSSRLGIIFLTRLLDLGTDLSQNLGFTKRSLEVGCQCGVIYEYKVTVVQNSNLSTAHNIANYYIIWPQLRDKYCTGITGTPGKTSIFNRVRNATNALTVKT